MCYCIAAKLLKMSRGSGDEFPEVIVLYALRALRSRVFYMPQVSSGSILGGTLLSVISNQSNDSRRT